MLRRAHCPKELAWVLLDAVGDNERRVSKAEKQGVGAENSVPLQISSFAEGEQGSGTCGVWAAAD